MLNRIVLIGRLTRDPEQRATSNGTAVTTFNIAVDRDFSTKDGKKETDFISIVTWRGLAETCGKFLTKGKLVAVAGRLQIRTYEDNEGAKRTVAEVVAEEVQFLSPKSESEASALSSTAYSKPAVEEMAPLDEIPF